jgi:hypothetical protein
VATKPKKTVCPLTREEFREKAQPLSITIDGQQMTAPPREFSTGSLGWNLNSKQQMMIGGVSVTVQIGMNVTLVGSKELPGRAAAAEGADNAESNPS